MLARGVRLASSCSADIRSARMAGLTWLYTPRIPGTSCPIRSDCRTSGMPASSIHVWWPCLRPCGVKPGTRGNHDASTTSAAGGCPEPTQRPVRVLCAITPPSSRRGTALPQTGHRPVAESLSR